MEPTSRIYVGMSEEEKELIQDYANKRRRSASSVVYEWIMEDIERLRLGDNSRSINND